MATATISENLAEDPLTNNNSTTTNSNTNSVVVVVADDDVFVAIVVVEAKGNLCSTQSYTNPRTLEG